MPSPGDELVNPVTGQTILFKQLSPDLLEVESGYRAGAPPAPSHLHPNQEERFEVLRGKVRCAVDGEQRDLEEGDVLEIPAGTPHEFGGHPDEDGRVLWQTRPALDTAGFFETSFALAQRHQSDLPRMEEVAAMLREYEDEFRLADPPPGLGDDGA